MSHHTISVRDLGFAYPDGTQALDGVSFEVGHGEAIAVVGANGAGKSTLLLHLNGLLTPQRGSVDIGGIPVTKGTLPDIRRTVGMVFQDPDDQLFMPTVAEDVGFGPLNLGLPPEDVASRVSPPHSPASARSTWRSARRTASPAARSARWPSPPCSPWSRTCWSWTSRPAASTRAPGAACSACSRASSTRGSSRPTTSTSPQSSASARSSWTADVCWPTGRRPTCSATMRLLEAASLERPLGMLACPVCAAGAGDAAESVELGPQTRPRRHT